MLDLASRWLGHSRKFDPVHLAALLPTPLSFSPENARRMAFSAASVLDIATLRRGVSLGDLFGTGAHPPRTVKPVAPAPAPASDSTKTAADFKAIRAELSEMRKKMAEADSKHVNHEKRLTDLEG